MAEVQSSPNVPEYKSLQRIHSIPLVNDSLLYAHNTLSANPYTQYAYATASAVGQSAYSLSQPVQVRLAPLIVRADGVVLKGLEVVESKFPYPFTTPTNEVIGTLKSSSDQAYNAFQTNIQAPAYSFAQTADKQLSPVVDRLEIVVNKLHGQESTTPSASSSESAETTPSATAGSKTQVGRAYRLSLDLKDQLYVLSGEQIRQLQQQSVIIQRATDTVYRLNEKLVAAYGTAKERSASLGKVTSDKVHGLSSGILQEVEKIQTSTKALPKHLQQSLQPLQTQLSHTLTDLKSVVQAPSSESSVPRTATQKAGQVVSTVQHQVGPVLEALKITISNLLAGAPAPVAEAAPVAVNGETRAE